MGQLGQVWRARIGILGLVAIACGVIYATNLFLTQRFTETTRTRAEVRLTLFVGNIMSELQRNAIVPQLLALDPELIRALGAKDYTSSTQRLLSFVDEVGAASIMLYDGDGRVVAATDRNRLGEMHRSAPYFVDALRSNQTVFTNFEPETAGREFIYSRKIEVQGSTIGVISVEVDLQRLERSWGTITDSILVTDSEGRIMLTSEARWRGMSEEAALMAQNPPTAIGQLYRDLTDWTSFDTDTYLNGDAVFRRELRVPFQGWKIISYTPYTAVRDRVNGILGLEIMGFAVLLSGAFWLSSRQTASKAQFFQRESAELRTLNLRLQQEIAEREKVERTLEVAEQSLAQSSKLAVLGEMSAAVSHELNQPLAAMKTYLAGARLLLTRKRPDEAMSSFQRIDDLIDRMGAITRQLKSYARKGTDAFEPVDTRACVSSALEMMEPQLKRRDVRITRTLPPEPAMIMGDRLRLEQVIINLLRNALDATKKSRDPAIDIRLDVGRIVTLSVHDNGEGIEDLDALFEPFYTTKEPGAGVGLGLAISSGIINDLGGRLTARNQTQGTGAIFEVRLPPMAEKVAAE